MPSPRAPRRLRPGEHERSDLTLQIDALKKHGCGKDHIFVDKASGHSGTNPSGSVGSQGARPQRGPETARSQRPEGSDGQNNVPGQVDALS